MSTLRATAYHEAGPAVAAVLLDVYFEKIDIGGDERAAGRIIYGDLGSENQEAEESGDRDQKLSAEDCLIVTLAGAIAQRRFSPRSDWLVGSTGNTEVGKIPALGSDLSNVTRRIRDLGYTGEIAENNQRELTARAEALVKENWPSIEKVAEALFEYKTLFPDDVQQLVFGSFDDGLDD